MNDQRHSLPRPLLILIILTIVVALLALMKGPSDAAAQPQPQPDGPSAKYTVTVNLCIAPGCTELASAISPADGVRVTVSDAATGEVFSSCTTGAEGPGTCTVDIRLVDTLAFTLDASTIPAGYQPDSNPQIVPNQATEPAAHATLGILLYPVNGFPQTQPTVVPPVETPVPTAPAPVPTTPALTGPPAGIYQGSCASGGLGARVAALDGPLVPPGAIQGATDAIPVRLAYTKIAVPFRDMLNGGLVLAVFDEANPQTMVACGPVGGVLDSTGALSLGLAPVNGSGLAGVAYLSAQNDATATGVSVFLIPVPATPAA